MDDIFLEMIDFKNKMLLDKVLEWRNDIDTRNNSINTSIITEDIFHNIIEKYKSSKYKPLIIYYGNNIDNPTENNPIGILTFIGGCNDNNDNNDNNNCFIGINIDPNYRNKQISSRALRKFINEFEIKDKIYAKIKKYNINSIKLFSKLFVFSHMDEDFMYYYYDFSNKNQVISSNGYLGL